jgi:hydrogenase maturation protein HypF
LRVRGAVQGVGFRVYVYGLAVDRFDLAGFVRNDGAGVLIEAEGPPARLDAFAAALEDRPPTHARIDAVTSEPLPVLGEHGFTIAETRW